MNIQMQVLEHMVLFDFIVGGSTGEKTMESDDFFRNVGRMLPKGAFSWVSKYRSEAKREVLRCGAGRRVNNRIRGYFVHVDKAEVLAARLSEIRDAFLAEKATFLESLPTIIETWASDETNQKEISPGLTRADLIRSRAPTIQDMNYALTFEMSAVKIGGTAYFGKDDALNVEVHGLAGEAAREIAEDIKRSWKGPVGNKTSSRVTGLIKRVRDKAEAMSFLSEKFDDLYLMCNKVLEEIPSEGPIEGMDFLKVSSLLSLCSTPQGILGADAGTIDPLVNGDYDDAESDDHDGFAASALIVDDESVDQTSHQHSMTEAVEDLTSEITPVSSSTERQQPAQAAQVDMEEETFAPFDI